MFSDRSKLKKGSTCMLHVRVVEAKNLLALDSGNTSDPYCTLKVGHEGLQKHQTARKDKTVNPVWDEDFTFGITEADLSDMLVCKVYDHDTWGRDGFLGRVLIGLDDLRSRPCLEGWFPMLDNAGEKPVPGSIYLKIALEHDIVADEALGDRAFVAKRHSLMAQVNAAAAGGPVALDTIKVAVCSWNCGNAPPPDDLSPWVPRDGFDLIAIGTQECEYKSRSGYSNCHEDWVGTVTKHLGTQIVICSDALIFFSV